MPSNEREGVLVSVRGEARRTVPPDSAVIAGMIAATHGSRAEAARAAASALDSLTADLAAIGGVRWPSRPLSARAGTTPQRSAGI